MSDQPTSVRRYNLMTTGVPHGDMVMASDYDALARQLGEARDLIHQACEATKISSGCHPSQLVQTLTYVAACYREYQELCEQQQALAAQGRSDDGQA